MDVKFVNTTSAKLSSLAILNGQLIALSDTSGLYYDLNDTRYALSAQMTIDSALSSTSTNPLQNNIIYDEVVNKRMFNYSSPSVFGASSSSTLIEMINLMAIESSVSFWINNSNSYPTVYEEVMVGVTKHSLVEAYGVVTIEKINGTTAYVTWRSYQNAANAMKISYTAVNSIGWSEWEKVTTGTDLSKKVGIPYQYKWISPTSTEISDVLYINTSDPYSDVNQPKRVYQQASGTTAITNMPPAYPKGTAFVGMRYVHYFTSTNILVELIAFPSGRRWYNNYVTNAWKGWTCEPANANNDTISAVRDDLEEIGTYTSTSYAEVGYNDNIVVGATICMQKLSKTRCNLYISYKIWTNNETDSNIFYFMSGEKIRNALGLKTLAAVDSQSQVTFTPSFDVDSNGNLTVVSAETALGVMGHTGIKAVIDATGLQIGRIYNDTGSYGSWPVGTFSDSLFKVNTYGQINFYGASYSI